MWSCLLAYTLSAIMKRLAFYLLAFVKVSRLEVLCRVTQLWPAQWCGACCTWAVCLPRHPHGRVRGHANGARCAWHRRRQLQRAAVAGALKLQILQQSQASEPSNPTAMMTQRTSRSALAPAASARCSGARAYSYVPSDSVRPLSSQSYSNEHKAHFALGIGGGGLGALHGQVRGRYGKYT